MLYELHYYGGPHDGQMAYSPRPYHAICHSDGMIYRADEIGEACLRWVDDETRRIDLIHRPNETSIA